MKFFQFILIPLFILLFFANSKLILAQDGSAPNITQPDTLEARVDKIIEEKEVKFAGSQNYQLYQKLELIVTKGSLQGQKIVVENGNLPASNVSKYRIGDNVIVMHNKDFQNNDVFYITDFIRREVLFFLFLIFITCTIAIAKWRGLLSLIGMAVSFLIIFVFLLPQIASGANPVLIAVLSSLLIIPISFFLSHGFNKKTLVAIAGTLISLIITGILANLFVSESRLTGFASEEASFLQAAKQGTINIQGLLLAGIIIGVLGVLDDITISQSAIVFQLKATKNKIQFGDLYTKAMNIGRDHISSMVNTLILVYAGAALPLLLLFIDNPHPFSEIVNYEIIADEIVRTLVGSIGLILAVPITTFIATWIALRWNHDASKS